MDLNYLLLLTEGFSAMLYFCHYIFRPVQTSGDELLGH